MINQSYEDYVKERLNVEMMMKKGKPIERKENISKFGFICLISDGLRNSGVL